MNTEQGQSLVPVIRGWLNMDVGNPHLIGNRCKKCGEYFFPKAFLCRNPNCHSDELEETLLSREGKLWSHTLNYYEPPAPYVSQGEFKPYTIVVAELPKEKLMILGPLADGYAYEDLTIGMDMELVLEPLYQDAAGNRHTVWKWKPLP